MVQLGEYIQIISPIIYGSALIVSILQFSAMKKRDVPNVFDCKPYLVMDNDIPQVQSITSNLIK